ncbi:unnamed protein product [Boreogadus saida]
MMLWVCHTGRERESQGGEREGEREREALTAIRPPVHTVEGKSQEGLCCIPLHQFPLFQCVTRCLLFGSFLLFVFFISSDVLRGFGSFSCCREKEVGARQKGS